MTDWFRSWHGAPTDHKWLGIARRAAVPTGIAVAIAWALMDRASQASERGSIVGYDAEGLGCFFGCDAEQVDAVVAAMTEKGMIRDGRLSAWETRQPKREDDSSQRVREHRKRNVTQRNAPEAEAEKKQKIEPIEQQPVAARAAALPPDWLERSLEANGVKSGFREERAVGLMNPAPIIGLLEAGYDFERDWIAGIKAKPFAGARQWSYFEGQVRDFAATRNRAASVPKPQPQSEPWSERLAVFRQSGTWSHTWGPKPGEIGCRVPAELLAQAA